jgi:hypothetical protein
MQTIKLTESELKDIIIESVDRILNEEFNMYNPFKSSNNELFNDGISIDNEELLNNYNLSNITLIKKGNYVTLTHFIVLDRNSGNGTRFMEDLVKNADRNGWILVLTPDVSFGASSTSRLNKFYKRFGFKDNKGRYTDFETRETMIRKPMNY